MSDMGGPLVVKCVHLETPHRAFNPMPVVTMLDVHDGRVELFLDIPPTAGRLLDRDANKVSVGRELTLDNHGHTSVLCARRPSKLQESYAAQFRRVAGVRHARVTRAVDACDFQP
jgi:hypothetical protein